MDTPSTTSEPPPGAEQARWFHAEVRPHDGQLKAYLRGSFPGVRDVDDVVQESYLRIWKAKAAQPIHSAKAFLFQVARRVALDLLRHNRRSPIDAVGDLAGLGVIEDGANAADAAGLQEKIDLLSDAIAALPNRRREIVILRKLKRFSQKEVASLLGLSERTVENQLARGVRQCEEHLRSRGIHSFYGDENGNPIPLTAASAGESERTSVDWAFHAGTVDRVLEKIEAKVKRKRIRRRRTAVAAAVATAVAVGIFWGLPPARDTSSVKTSATQRQTLVLADGSQAELNAQTAIRTEFRHGQRLVRLDRGEAFFSVVRDPAHPFRVETSAGSIRVTGTKFDVRLAADGSAEVTLVEGSVLAGNLAADPVRLSPGQQLAFDSSQSSLRSLSASELEDATAWRQGRLVLDGLTLAEAAARFSAYCGREIAVAPEVAGLRPGGSASLDNLAGFLDALPHTLPVRVVANADGTYRIVAP